MVFAALPCGRQSAGAPRAVCRRWRRVAADDTAVRRKSCALVASGKRPKGDWLCMGAAAAGHLGCLVDARDRGRRWSSATCAMAAANGHLDVLEYARAGGCSWTEWTCRAAAAAGNLRTLQWAREHGCPWDHDTMRAAAAQGRLDCLAYTLETACPPAMGTAIAAAESGRLVCLDLLCRQRWYCPDERVCEVAAKGGHLDCMTYLRTHGHSWRHDTVTTAAAGGHLDVLRYARENGCPLDSDIGLGHVWRYGGAGCTDYITAHAVMWVRARGRALVGAGRLCRGRLF